jgi:hypothetical protein
VARGLHHRCRRPDVRRPRRARDAGGAAVLRADGARPVHAELADAHERRHAERPPVGRVLRPPHRGRPERHLHDDTQRRADPSGGRRHRVRVLPPSTEELARADDERGVLRSRELPPRLRCGDRAREAGGQSTRGEHGHPPHRPPRHPRLRQLQARRRHHELQHLRRHHRRLHARARGRREVRAPGAARLAAAGRRPRAGRRGPRRTRREGGVAGHLRSRVGDRRLSTGSTGALPTRLRRCSRSSRPTRVASRISRPMAHARSGT